MTLLSARIEGLDRYYTPPPVGLTPIGADSSLMAALLQEPICPNPQPCPTYEFATLRASWPAPAPPASWLYLAPRSYASRTRVGQGTWDVLRGGPPYPDERRGIELGGAFNNHNVEKLGVTINMRLPEGRELARQLISVSDVVAENFSAGVMERWGLTYDEMRAIKPDIIYVSNSGCGHEGPYRTYKTFGPVVQALSGLTFQSALPDMPPAGWGYSYMDHGGAYAMCIAILMALYHRNATGEGAAGGHVMYRRGCGHERTGSVGLHGQRAAHAQARTAQQQSERVPSNGPPRHIQVRWRRPLGGYFGEVRLGLGRYV